MAASAPQTPAGDDRNLVTVDENYLAPSFEDRLQIFWEKHGRTITAIILIVVMALVVRWAFGVFAERREAAIRAEFAAADSREELRAFMEAHPEAALSGVAALRLADESFEAGKYIDAQADYLWAARLLRQNPLEARARLGAAMSPLLSGDGPSARNALQELANDTALAASVRAEAAYHLAVVDRDAGKFAQATKWTGVVLSVDPEGIWAQRALQLRSSLPAGAESAEAKDDVAENAPPAVALPAAK